MNNRCQKKEDFGNRFERLFTELCGNQFLKGFVFHSPKIYNPTEMEVGDVVLWVRQFVINFELVSQNHELSNTTKKFVSRIGRKRKQLIRDRLIFHDPAIEIEFKNELNQTVYFDKQDLQDCDYLGVVLVDCNIPFEKMHFDSFAKSTQAGFPLAIMTLNGFRDLLGEIDTVPDLVYYLNDRHKFVSSVYARTPRLFLDLNLRTEKNLISFYKINENQFIVGDWNESDFNRYPEIYTQKWGLQIDARNRENEATYAIDAIAHRLRELGDEEAKLHTWELAMLSRRERAAGVGQKIHDALIQLQHGKEKRWFANYSDVTKCWSVFYFRNGATVLEFNDELELLTRQKMIVEIDGRDFEYSVFGYGFLKLNNEPEISFDYAKLIVKDAEDESLPLNTIELKEAQEHFNGGSKRQIKEFPDIE